MPHDCHVFPFLKTGDLKSKEKIQGPPIFYFHKRSAIVACINPFLKVGEDPKLKTADTLWEPFIGEVR